MTTLILDPPPPELRAALERAAAGDEVIVKDGARVFRISPIGVAPPRERPGYGDWAGQMDLGGFDDEIDPAYLGESEDMTPA